MKEDKNETWLLVSNKHPYHAYAVGSYAYCEEKIKCKKYQKNHHIRKALDNFDGCYRIDYKGGVVGLIGYGQLSKEINQMVLEGKQIQFVGTERDWRVMQNQDVCVRDSIRGFGRDISQEWSKELNKTEL